MKFIFQKKTYFTVNKQVLFFYVQNHHKTMFIKFPSGSAVHA